MAKASRLKVLSVHSDTAHGRNLHSSVLTSLWIEQPANCSLHCPMCFANTLPLKGKRAPQPIPDESYEAIIRDFASMPGKETKKLAIPGAGEPFHEFNREVTWKIVKLTAALEMPLTIFTTAHLMLPDDIESLSQYEHMLLLVKYNSKKRHIQDRLVFRNPNKPTDPSYFERREEVLDSLISAGFNRPPDKQAQSKYGYYTRLGIVTSIMEQNIDEVISLLKMARDNNLVFDCDTILPRGRGERFSRTREHLCGHELDLAIREKIEELQRIDREVYGNEWSIGGTYVGDTCTRFRNHLYIDVHGDVHPCIGATKVTLGNVKNYAHGDLQRIWDDPLMQVIRDRKYTGVCPTCSHFGTDCHSCLGRSTVRDRKDKQLCDGTLEKKELVFTRGCLNHRSKLNILIAEKSYQLRSVLMSNLDEVSDHFRQALERDPRGPRNAIEKGNLENLWLSEAASENASAEEIGIYKDHFLRDLQGAPWRWTVRQKESLNQLLPMIFLPFLARLFDPDLDSDEMLLWCNLLLYDEVAKRYFYRIVVRDSDEAATKNVLLSRWAEAEQLLQTHADEDALYSERILDLSDVLRDSGGRRFNYRMVLKGDYREGYRNKEGGAPAPAEVFDVRSFLKGADIQKRIRNVHRILDKAIGGAFDPSTGVITSIVAKRILKPSDRYEEASIGVSGEESEKLTAFYSELSKAFFDRKDRVDVSGVPQNLLHHCRNERMRDASFPVETRLVNYLIFLGAMHKDLAGYEVRHAHVHGQAESDSSGIVLASRLAKTGLRKPLSREQLPDELLASVDIGINMMLMPIATIYEERFVRQNEKIEQLARYRHRFLGYFGEFIEDCEALLASDYVGQDRRAVDIISNMKASLLDAHDRAKFTILERNGKRDEIRSRLTKGTPDEFAQSVKQSIDRLMRRIESVGKEDNPRCNPDVVDTLNLIGDIAGIEQPADWKHAILECLRETRGGVDMNLIWSDIALGITLENMIFNTFQYARADSGRPVINLSCCAKEGFVWIVSRNSITQGKAKELLQNWNDTTHTATTGRGDVDRTQRLIFDDKPLPLPKTEGLESNPPEFQQWAILGKIGG